MFAVPRQLTWIIVAYSYCFVATCSFCYCIFTWVGSPIFDKRIECYLMAFLLQVPPVTEALFL